jgi:Rap1a immunity proteins
MKILVTALTLAAGAFAVATHAAEAALTAGDLQELCAGSDHVSRNVCRVYILGVTEGIAQGLSIAAGKGSRACIPAAVSAERLEEIIKSRLIQDLSTSPARSSADAAAFLATALAEAFPCAGSGATPH